MLMCIGMVLRITEKVIKQGKSPKPNSAGHEYRAKWIECHDVLGGAGSNPALCFAQEVT